MIIRARGKREKRDFEIKGEKNDLLVIRRRLQDGKRDGRPIESTEKPRYSAPGLEDIQSITFGV